MSISFLMLLLRHPSNENLLFAYRSLYILYYSDHVSMRLFMLRSR
jgi:hypothetical protein